MLPVKVHIPRLINPKFLLSAGWFLKKTYLLAVFMGAPMNKKSCLIIFTLFLVAMPLLFSIASIVENLLIEFQMEQALMKGNMQTITVDRSEIIWLKSGEEALINGRMFDVASFKTNERQLTLTGLFDIREENFKKTLQAIDEHQNKPYKGKINFLVLLLGTSYNLNEPIVLHSPPVVKPIQSCNRSKAYPLNTFIEILIPPPRIPAFLS